MAGSTAAKCLTISTRREREKLARRRRRLIRWLDCLPARERDQLLAAVADRFGVGIQLLEEPPDSAAAYSEEPRA